jgi:uncharacterized protein
MPLTEPSFRCFSYLVFPINNQPMKIYVAVVVIQTFCLSASGQTREVFLKSIPYKLTWENSPLSFTDSGDELVIEAGEKTDMFRDPNALYNTDNAPKVLFLPDSNFILMASIAHGFSSKWDGGAIVLKADSANWIKFCYEKDYTGARRVVSVVTKNISDDCNSVALNSNTVHFKVAKAGKVITLYYSTDRKSWMLVRHFQFESPKPILVGLWLSPPQEKAARSHFQTFVTRPGRSRILTQAINSLVFQLIGIGHQFQNRVANLFQG